MLTPELHDSEMARRYVLQSICRQTVLSPSVETVTTILEWGLELAALGEPLPPLGFIADVGHLVYGTALQGRSHEALAVPGWPSGLARTYEDYVLGKLYADSSFDRGATALCRYQGRDRARGLAFLITAFQQRSRFGGAILSPAILKSLLQRPAEVLPAAWESFETDGLLTCLPDLYVELCQTTRNLGSVLAPEDTFELEHRTALMQFGERLGLRQVLQASARLESALPRQPLRTAIKRQEVATHLLDEDTYPVGGFSSISTRGTIESLLHSQLAYMEPADSPEPRPDLFDIKFLRDELLYYSRDENQFLRRRRSFVFVLHADLQQSRVKDSDLDWQRLVVALAFVLTGVRRLTEWLSEDALVFHIIFPFDKDDPLVGERKLFEMLLREQIANGTVMLHTLTPHDAVARCERWAERSVCHALLLMTADRKFEAQQVNVHRVLVQRLPQFATGIDPLVTPAGETPLASWQTLAVELLSRCA